MDPLLALVIVVALVCVTVVIVVLATKKRGASETAAASQASVPQPPAPALEEISFKQALESDALAGRLEELAKKQVECALGLESEGAVVHTLSVAEEHGEIVLACEYSPDAAAPQQTTLAMIPLQETTISRQEAKQFLPTVKGADGRSGALTARRALTRTKAAEAAALLRGVAHVVAGMDVLRALKEINRNLSALAQGRSIDQLAEIETVYNRIAEIFSGKNWIDRRSDLTASRDQLYKLRATWRRELEQIVNSAPETPDTQAVENFAKMGAAFFPPAFFFGKGLETRREAEEEKLFGHLSIAADLIQCIRLAMLLDISVSQALGEAETLAGVAMRNELEMWDGVVENFKTKRKGIRTFDAPGELQTVEDALQGYVHMLSAMTSTASSGPARSRGEQQPSLEASFASLPESAGEGARLELPAIQQRSLEAQRSQRQLPG